MKPYLQPAIAPPRLIYSLSESARFVYEMNAMLLAHPLLKRAPRGDGHPVLVIPGFLANDGSTVALRHYIARWGYDTHGWQLGRNVGIGAARPDLETRLQQRLGNIVRRRGSKVSLVGWSLGGVLARELARAYPDLVRQVITLGSPIAAHPKATSLWRLYELAADVDVDSEWYRARLESVRQPLPGIPCTSIYSESDGIVAPAVARETPAALAENIRVRASHIGLGFNPTVLYAVADRLAQPEGDWQPFRRDSWRRLFYPQR